MAHNVRLFITLFLFYFCEANSTVLNTVPAMRSRGMESQTVLSGCASAWWAEVAVNKFGIA